MSGLATSSLPFASSARRHSAPELRTARAEPSGRAAVFDLDKDLPLFHGMLRHCSRHEPEATAKALFACFDRGTRTLDLTQLPAELAGVPYRMPASAWSFLNLLGPIAKVQLPQTDSGDLVSRAFPGLKFLPRLRELSVLMPRDGERPSFKGLSLHLGSTETISIRLKAVAVPAHGARAPGAARAPIPVALEPAPAETPLSSRTRAAVALSQPSAEPPTRHLSMPAAPALLDPALAELPAHVRPATSE